MSVGELAISEGRSEAIEALLDGSLPAGVSAVREVPVAELSALTGLDADELEARGFRGLQVWPDLDLRAIDGGETPSLGVLRDGWLWVDQVFFDAAVSVGSRGDTARALVARAAAMTTRAAGGPQPARVVPLPEAVALDELRSPRSPYPFTLFQDGHGRYGLCAPDDGDRRVPEAVGSVVRVIVESSGGLDVGTGCVVEVDLDSIWIITARHLLGPATTVAVAVARQACHATVVAPDERYLADALAEERGLPVDAPQIEAHVRGLDLMLLRLDRDDGPEQAVTPVPLAEHPAHLMAATTVGYTAHPRAAAVLEDMFGDAMADVVLVSTGVLHLSTPSTTGPVVNFSEPVTAQQAGGGHVAIVADDPWPGQGSAGAPVFVDTGGRGDPTEYALAGVTLTPTTLDTDAGPRPLLLLADSAAVRALLRARPGSGSQARR